MTTRERLEAKLDRRQEWADKATARSQQHADTAYQMADAIPMGQPILVGHHSEKRDRRYRERIGGHASRSVEEAQKAQHHASKADGLERQLDRSIFSDDPDAVEALEAKVEALETERDAMKRANAAGGKVPLCNYSATEPVPCVSRFGGGELRLRQVEMSKAEYAAIHKDYRGTQVVAGSHRVRAAMIRHELVSVFLMDTKVTPPPAPAPTTKKPCATWEISNLGARIRQAKERIADVQRQQERTEQAEDAGGVHIVTNEGANWCTVTFAEKPERDVLDALRDAGYRWGAGCWSGYADRLPAIVRDLAPLPAESGHSPADHARAQAAGPQ